MPKSPKESVSFIVSTRREIAALMGDLIHTAEQDPRMERHPDFAREFSSRLFALRQNLGRLQSDWRAVNMIEDAYSYSSAAAPVGDAIRAYVRWASDGLAARA